MFGFVQSFNLSVSVSMTLFYFESVKMLYRYKDHPFFLEYFKTHCEMQQDEDYVDYAKRTYTQTPHHILIHWMRKQSNKNRYLENRKVELNLVNE